MHTPRNFPTLIPVFPFGYSKKSLPRHRVHSRQWEKECEMLDETVEETTEDTTRRPFYIEIPDFAVIALIGVSGSGKSTFARTHFRATEILSSDRFRGLVSDDENDQSATTDAFDALHYLAAIRLRNRKSVVIDATNVQPDARKQLLSVAKAHDCLAVAIVLDAPESVCAARNATRADRQFGPHVIRNQSRNLRQSLRNLKREGFRYVFALNPAQIEEAQITRIPLWTDRRAETGPFDLIGDVHGCYDELVELLTKLNYAPDAASGAWTHPLGRRIVFLGDLVDRGPKVVETVRLAQQMMAAGTAFCVPGNHDMKLMRALSGKNVTVSHGLAESLAQIDALPEAERESFKTEYVKWADGLVSHLWLDGGKLCAAHAGMKEDYIGRASGRVREFALFGETTGETDDFGLPVRYPWASDYRGKTTVVYGHTPVPSADWLNNTLNLDTGCVFGGALTALMWPESEIVSVAAKQTYAEPIRPFLPAKKPAAPDREDIEKTLLALAARHIETRKIGAEAVRNKHRLQADADKYARMRDELEAKAQNAESGGNAELAAQFRKAKAGYERTGAEMETPLAEAVSMANTVLRALLDAETKLRQLAEQASVALPDFDAALDSEVAEANAPVFDPKAEALINAAVRDMKDNQIKNRELAVQAISSKNNLQAEADKNDRMEQILDQKMQDAVARDDQRQIRDLLKDKKSLNRIQDKVRADLEAAIVATDKIKAALHEDEERVRNRASEAMLMKGRLRHTEIQKRTLAALASFELLELDIAQQFEKLQARLADRQASEAAQKEMTYATSQWQHDELLRAEDVLGKRLIATETMANIMIPAANAAAALEVMSRFAVEPRWLIYLPPTMSPCETAPDGDLLERPEEAFAYYRGQGVKQVICQRKHMGSRAVVVVCRNEEAAFKRFGQPMGSGITGQIFTRTGRQFFDEAALNAGLLAEIQNAMTAANFWEEFQTDWFCLDCELMPWNAKAQGLLREQYAPVGAAAKAALAAALQETEIARARGLDLAALTESLTERKGDAAKYTDAYARYCWPVSGLTDLRIAPFHLLASEGRTYFDLTHDRQIEVLSRLAQHSANLIATESRIVNTNDAESVQSGADWWRELTENGGEGMVVKPLEWLVRGAKGWAQPALKVRGREYLRIIYGPEYTQPANLNRLRSRGLGAKRSLALREFALGREGLRRFTQKQPLRQVHECAFGVLALESEPVDPRL